MKERIILAGGCFWCMVHPFNRWEGVESVVSGYTGGHLVNPTYSDVTKGTSGHTEAVEIIFDSEKMPLEKILGVYWQIIDPYDLEGQFVDRGSSYRPSIYVTSEKQREIAIKSRQEESSRRGKPESIQVPILDAQVFYPAEEYHQDFYLKNPDRYERYRRGSGRPNFD